MKLTDEQVKEIVSIKDDDITRELFIKLFGMTEDNLNPKYQPNDWFILKKGMSSYYNGPDIKTTIGKFIFNVFLNFSIFGNALEYYHGHNYMEFDSLVVKALTNGKISIEKNPEYQTKRSWLEYSLAEILVPGISYKSLVIGPRVKKRKEELFKQYEKELKAGDPIITQKIEKELIDLVKEEYKDDPSMRLYYTKEKPNLGNHYKNLVIMVGATKSNTDGSYHVFKDSYIDGIDKQDFTQNADGAVTGSYYRSVGTQVGGAMTKVYHAALQTETVSINASTDCKSHEYLKIFLDDSNKSSFFNRYFKGSNGNILLTEDNYKNYLNKELLFRSPLYCKSKDYCATCCGPIFARLKIRNAGIMCSDIGNKIMNSSMKKMHDLTLKTARMDFCKYFKDYNK